MPIIDLTYFIGDINIAQLGQAAVQEKVGAYIDKYEAIFLRRLLGYSLSKQFLEGLQAPTVEQKWLDLRDGAEYTGKDGHLKKWTGFTDKSASSIANYVYFEYTRSEARFLVGSGAITPKTENAVRVSPIDLQVFAWNEMVRLNYELYAFLKAKEDVYGPYDMRVDFDIHYYWRCENWRRHCRVLPELLVPTNTFNI